ncbi:MAG TPA: type II toxin-antitoxin system VapC family toxin [Candidatus Sulfotelmatobacter sp.]
MNFLLDTNPISEWVKPQPNAGLTRWMQSVDEDSLFLSVISLAELRYGIDRMASGKRRSQLDEWLRYELPVRFEGRILPIDQSTAHTCGRIVRRAELLGRPIELMDAFLAATAEVHSLTVVTRNVTLLSVLKSVFNPWA